jgi:uncharacterized protein
MRMRRAEIIVALTAQAEKLHTLGVAHIDLFGSAARDELAADSDIDLIVAGPPERPITLFRLAAVQTFLEELFQRRVDLTAAQGLANAPAFQKRIDTDRARVF